MKKSREKSKNPKQAYLTNEDLLPEILKAKEIGRITPKLAKMFMILVQRYSEHAWWVGYSQGWKEEMMQDALLALCKGSLKFDPSYAERNGKTPNFFSYATTICYRSFKSTRDKHKKQTDIEEACPQGLF